MGIGKKAERLQRFVVGRVGCSGRKECRQEHGQRERRGRVQLEWGQDSLLNFLWSFDPTRLAGCGFRPSVSRRAVGDTRSEGVGNL